VVGLLARHRESDYWTYEHKDTWYVGIHSEVSLMVDCTGNRGTTIHRDGQEESRDINRPLNDVAREFIAQYSTPGVKIFGQVAFNYNAHITGQAYNSGTWPLLSLIIPCIQVTIHKLGSWWVDPARMRPEPYPTSSRLTFSTAPHHGSYSPFHHQSSSRCGGLSGSGRAVSRGD